MSLFRHTTRRQASQTVDESHTTTSITMEDFQCEVMRALWHPFEILDDGKTGKVQVSRLKVITSNIGLRLGHKKAEEYLNKDDVTSMTFEEFFQVIKQELLDKIEDSPNEEENATASHSLLNKKQPTMSELLHGIIKTCWTFCSFERINKATGMTIEHCMILWRLFNFLSECDENRVPVLPIRLHREEVSVLLKEFIDHSGQRNKECVIKEFIEQDSESNVITFTEFLNLFEKDFADSLSRNDITQGLNHLFEFYIMNVLAKEMMWKRGYNVKHWKERWLVLTTTGVKYYVNNTEKALKGDIIFDSECKVEVPPDRPTNRPNRFVISTKRKPYEISAPDAKTKNEWVSAIQVALKCVGENPNIQKEAAFQRCLQRIQKKRQEEEEEKKRLEEADRLRKQQEELDEERRKRLEDEELLTARQNELEEERRRRAEMEDKYLEEQRLREEEQQRLRELEAIKRELERLLEEERQAKKDEEIVRNLQAKLLEEEFQRREELERLKQQQEEMLIAEREQKAVLEGDRREQERILREAKERLEQLEREQAAAAEKMQEATEKLQKAEKDRLIMQEKVKLYKTKTSVGLNRPVQPVINPLITHRGLGAFCEKDFARKPELTDNQNETTKNDDDSAPPLDEMKYKTDNDSKTKETIEQNTGVDGQKTEKDGHVNEYLQEEKIVDGNLDIHQTDETSKEIEDKKLEEEQTVDTNKDISENQKLNNDFEEKSEADSKTHTIINNSDKSDKSDTDDSDNEVDESGSQTQESVNEDKKGDLNANIVSKESCVVETELEDKSVTDDLKINGVAPVEIVDT